MSGGLVVVASVVVVVYVVLVRSLIKFLFRTELALLVVLVVQMAVVVPSAGACVGMVDILGFAGLRE